MATTDDARRATRLLEFLTGYGDLEPPPPQQAEDADTDPQMFALMATLSAVRATHPVGVVIDLGCGKGTLLRRVASADGWMGAKAWSYVGVDERDYTKQLLYMGVDLGVHEFVRGQSLDTFHAAWPPRTAPFIVVIRNVLHELDIAQTAELMASLSQHLSADDVLIIQDLTVFPRAEKGNCCWEPAGLSQMLAEFGFSVSFSPDTSKSGNRWVTLVAKRIAEGPPSPRDVVRNHRTAQWRRWHAVGALYPDDEAFRGVQLAKLDLDLQFAALTKQLLDAGADVLPLTTDQEHLVARETFTKALLGASAGMSGSAPLHTAPPSLDFTDRADNQSALQSFLSSDATWTTVGGPPLMGKTYLVRYVLATFPSGRNVVEVDAQATTTVWNILEGICSQLNVPVATDVLARLQRVSFKDVRSPLVDAFRELLPRAVVVVDHAERLLDSNGKLQDREISTLLLDICSTQGAKLVLTTRRQLSATALPERLSYTGKNPVVARFPRELHVENVLSRLLGRVDFPTPLVGAIDRHPFLAWLAARVIQSGAVKSYDDPEFLEELKGQLRDQLLRRVLATNPLAREALETVSLARTPLPEEVVLELCSRSSIDAAVSLGLMYLLERPGRSRVVAPLGALRVRSIRVEPTGESDVSSVEESEFRRRHLQLGGLLRAHYRQIDDDPQWLREAHYHLLLAGDRQALSAFGAAYRGEVAAVGEHWFRDLKRYEDALWAFTLVREEGDTSSYVAMRVASCLMRVGRVEDGEAEYAGLRKKNPMDDGIVQSYVDSLLFIDAPDRALKELETRFPLAKLTSSTARSKLWVLGQYGRAYLGLERNKEAADMFRQQLKHSQEAYVYRSLAQALHKLGDRDSEGETLRMGRHHNPGDKRLLVAYGSWLEKNGSPDRALEILRGVLAQDPSSGWALNAAVQALGALERTDEAVELWEKHQHLAVPEWIRPSIEAHVRVLQGRFEQAIKVLASASPRFRREEQALGHRADVYFQWAQSCTDLDEQVAIAERGLDRVGIPKMRNVPLLAIQGKLAHLIGDWKTLDAVLARMKTINPSGADLRWLSNKPRS